MLYAHAIAGSAEAAHFLSLSGPSAAPGIVASIMNIKLQTYLRFNETYPRFWRIPAVVYFELSRSHSSLGLEQPCSQS